MSIDAVSNNDQTNQSVSTPASNTNADSTAPDFATLLKTQLGDSGKKVISEEELFSAVSVERVGHMKGASAAASFKDILAKKERACTASDGFILHEKATTEALQQMTKNGLLSSDERDQIYSQAFGAAQLDNNLTTLWDSRGGGSDITVATATMTEALTSAYKKITAYDSNDEIATPLSLGSDVTSSTPTSSQAPVSAGPVIKPHGTTIDGPAGFLFKPISSNEGKLAIILPAQFANEVESVVLKNKAGKVIDRGRSTGFGDAGVQEKFAFGRQGAQYPKHLTVQVRLKDGTTQRYQIPDPSKRYD